MYEVWHGFQVNNFVSLLEAAKFAYNNDGLIVFDCPHELGCGEAHVLTPFKVLASLN